MGPSTAKAKAMPSVTLTPTGGSGNRNVKKRPAIGKGATPLRPIEAQSVVNIAGMKYLVVPHPDPGKNIKFLMMKLSNKMLQNLPNCLENKLGNPCNYFFIFHFMQLFLTFFLQM